MADRRLKLAILCGDDAHHKYLISALSSNFDVAAVVIEPGSCQKKMMLKKKKIKRYMYSLYHSARRMICGLNSYRKKYFVNDFNENTSFQCMTLTINHINQETVIQLLNECQPDLTVVMGTTILGKKLIEACGRNIINIHGGYLPYYRGNHCFFFAMFNSEFDKIGSTIHFINTGIDTGDIIEVVKPLIEIKDTPEKLYCRAEMLAINRLISMIKDYEEGIPFPRVPQNLKEGNLYRTEDRKLSHDLIFWFRRKTGRIVIPVKMACRVNNRF